MNFSVDTTRNFKKEAKKLIKKYPSLKEELNGLDEELSKNPIKGLHLGNNIYKIRLAIKSKGKGKRGGGRVITKALLKNKLAEFNPIFTLDFDISIEQNRRNSELF